MTFRFGSQVRIMQGDFSLRILIQIDQGRLFSRDIVLLFL